MEVGAPVNSQIWPHNVLEFTLLSQDACVCAKTQVTSFAVLDLRRPGFR